MTSNNNLAAFDLHLPISSLDAYIAYANQIPMLSPAEENALATQLQKNNDLSAAKKLVLAHLRYVIKVAKGYAGYGLPLGDLIQEGNIGLMKAVKRFDPTMGTRLVTFAVHWVKAEIHEFILKNWRIVKVATTKAQRKLFFNLRGMKKHLKWLTHDEVNEVANDLKVKPETVREMEMRLSSSDTSFDYHDDEDENDFAAPVSYLEDTRFSPAKIYEADHSLGQSNTRLHQALKQLDPRSQEILQARWLNEEKLTLQDLADKYQVSAERIRQLEKIAMEKLKGSLK